jgi:hypothetical protein
VCSSDLVLGSLQLADPAGFTAEKRDALAWILSTRPSINYLQEQDFGMVSLADQSAAAGGESVQAITVDSLGLERCDLIKLDVEGMEMRVLAGAAATLERHRPWCWAEYWLAGREVMADFFLRRGYRVWAMDELNLLCAPLEKIPSSGFQVDAPELTLDTRISTP